MQSQTLNAPSRSPFRAHWALDPNVTFLNHGSFGACPKAVLDFQARLRSEMEAEPVQFLARRYEERLEPSRSIVMDFLGAGAGNLAFVTNSTTGVNAVVRSFPLRPDDEILTTSLDYNACHNVLVEAARVAGARVVVARIPFPLASPAEVTASILSAVTDRTRLALLDHVASDTGTVMPIASLVSQLEARGVATLIDGAHAPGMVDLRLEELGASFYTGNLHKWVCAPKGAGFLWARADRQATVQPAVISHGNNRRRTGFSEFQDRFDWAGTFDPTAWMSAGAAIRFMGELLPGGWVELRERNRELCRRARSLLLERLAVTAPCPESMLGALATIPLPSRFQGRVREGAIDREQLELFDRYAIEVPFHRVEGRRYLRIAAQIYNSLEEFAWLGEALERIE